MSEPIVEHKRRASSDGMVLRLQGELARARTLVSQLELKLQIAERINSLPLLNRIYARHGAGCCWHIVLDDGNTGRSSREFSANYAVENECAPCIEASQVLLTCSETQLRKARGHRHL